MKIKQIGKLYQVTDFHGTCTYVCKIRILEDVHMNINMYQPIMFVEITDDNHIILNIPCIDNTGAFKNHFQYTGGKGDSTLQKELSDVLEIYNCSINPDRDINFRVDRSNYWYSIVYPK